MIKAIEICEVLVYALTLTFMAIKFTSMPALSWWVVFSPAIIYASVLIVTLFLAFISVLGFEKEYRERK